MPAAGDSCTFESSEARLYAAVLRTIASLGYSVKHSDGAARLVSFNTGMSMRSWAGQDMTASVSKGGQSGTSILTLGGTRAQTGNIFGGGGQIYDWGERGKIGRVFFRALETALKQIPEPAESDPSKKCPYCAETIKRDAVLCRYCGRELAEGERNSRQVGSPQPAPPALKWGVLSGDGHYRFDVVGESHYQDNLEDVVGGRTGSSAHFQCVAVLAPDPGNQYDANAVVVRIDNKIVAYLRRDQAPLFKSALTAGGFAGASVNAVVAGGWDRGGSDKGNFGVRLDAYLPFSINVTPPVQERGGQAVQKTVAASRAASATPAKKSRKVVVALLITLGASSLVWLLFFAQGLPKPAKVAPAAAPAPVATTTRPSPPPDTFPPIQQRPSPNTIPPLVSGPRPPEPTRNSPPERVPIPRPRPRPLPITPAP